MLFSDIGRKQNYRAYIFLYNKETVWFEKAIIILKFIRLPPYSIYIKSLTAVCSLINDGNGFNSKCRCILRLTNFLQHLKIRFRSFQHKVNNIYIDYIEIFFIIVPCSTFLASFVRYEMLSPEMFQIYSIMNGLSDVN